MNNYWLDLFYLRTYPHLELDCVKWLVRLGFNRPQISMMNSLEEKKYGTIEFMTQGDFYFRAFKSEWMDVTLFAEYLDMVIEFQNL